MIVLNMLIGLAFVFMAGACLSRYTEEFEGLLLMGAVWCLLMGVTKVFHTMGRAIEMAAQ